MIVAGNLGILILGLALISIPEGLRTFMRLVSVLALIAAILAPPPASSSASGKAPWSERLPTR